MTDVASGSILLPPWSGMTLPGLLAGAAKLRAQAAFVADGEGAETLARRPARALTCIAAHDAVHSLARRLRDLGLRPGETVVIHLPNIVEAAVAILGVQCAGGVPALVPIFEQRETLRRCVALTSAKAILTIGEFAGLHPGLKCREVALDEMGVRFIGAFGPDAPAGLVALDEFRPAAGDDLPAIAGPSTAILTFDAADGQIRALARSHEQIVLDAAAAASSARSTLSSRLLSAIPPMSAAGVALGLGLPLLTGAQAEMLPLFDSCAFASQLGDGEATSVILPGGSEAAFRQFCEERSIACEGLVLVHRPSSDDPVVRVPEAGHVHCVDALCLGESLVAISRRGDERALEWLPERRIHPVEGVLAGGAPHHVIGVEGGVMTVSGPGAPSVQGVADRPVPTGFGAGEPRDGRIWFEGRSGVVVRAA
jgi:acyl-CoA synthetase (AMP-forming)/AMP-acid ligase II